jgi:hypothetical protein
MNDFEVRELYDKVQEMEKQLNELQDKKQCQCSCCMED